MMMMINTAQTQCNDNQQLNNNNTTMQTPTTATHKLCIVCKCYKDRKAPIPKVPWPVRIEGWAQLCWVGTSGKQGRGHTSAVPFKERDGSVTYWWTSEAARWFGGRSEAVTGSDVIGHVVFPGVKQAPKQWFICKFSSGSKLVSELQYQTPITRL